MTMQQSNVLKLDKRQRQAMESCEIEIFCSIQAPFQYLPFPQYCTRTEWEEDWEQTLLNNMLYNAILTTDSNYRAIARLHYVSMHTFKGKWQYIFLLSQMTELVELYNTVPSFEVFSIVHHLGYSQLFIHDVTTVVTQVFILGTICLYDSNV